ncbi:MAG TPA: RagB/SusD family nutrient uptake outer membrane protein [Bacteroidales bacterium]|nr:RagB/SusD family nutrient uptake outer membrane protein [Bacteroidales bacterium]
MKKIKYYMLFVFLLLHFACSEDFLNMLPLSSEAVEGYFYSDENAISAINGCYDILIQNEGNSPDMVWMAHHYEWMMGDVASGNVRKGSKPSDMPELLAIEKWEADPSSKISAGLWIKGFAGIQRCNFVLNNLPKSENVSPGLKNRILGEASLLRGHFYFFLLRHFGGVPIATENIQPSEYGKKQRDSFHEVCLRIEEDLLEAIRLLPNKSTYASKDKGRVTNGTARSLLSRFYMYQIGTDNKNTTTDWNDVYQQTSAVISSGEYQLLDNYAKVFTSDYENSSESIFEYQGLEGVADAQPEKTGSTITLLMGNRKSGTSYSGWGFNNPSSELFNAFGNSDPRRASTCYGIGYNNFILFGQIQGYARDQQGSNYLNRKFVIYEMPKTMPKSSNYNIRYLRYSDVLLMHAEAAFHIGNEAIAREYLNMVRKRAENSTYCQGWVVGKPLEYTPFVGASVPDITSSGQDLLNAIWRERKLELACEGYSSWDLIRTGQYFDVIDYAKNTYLDPSAPGPGADLSEMRFENIRANALKHTIEGANGIRVPLLPLPQFDVDDWNLEQNPGY